MYLKKNERDDKTCMTDAESHILGVVDATRGSAKSGADEWAANANSAA